MEDRILILEKRIIELEDKHAKDIEKISRNIDNHFRVIEALSKSSITTINQMTALQEVVGYWIMSKKSKI